MEIKNLSTNTFNGRYVLKGNPKAIEDFRQSFYNSIIQTKKLKDGSSYNLTGIYSESQPYAEYLFVTNDDVLVLGDFLHSTVLSMKQIMNNLLHYHSAECRGQDSLADVLIDLYQKSRMTLTKIFGDNIAKNIKIIDVNDALRAVECDKFDYKDGNIIK